MDASYPIYITEGVIVAAALTLLLVRNLFAAALVVMAILIFISGLYFLIGAEFIGVTQLLIYAGGIIVVILFGIMLTSKKASTPSQKITVNLWGAAIIGLPLLTGLLLLYNAAGFNVIVTPVANTLPSVGISLMTDLLLPFELSGILLLVALIGAAVVINPKAQ